MQSSLKIKPLKTYKLSPRTDKCELPNVTQSGLDLRYHNIHSIQEAEGKKSAAKHTLSSKAITHLSSPERRELKESMPAKPALQEILKGKFSVERREQN